MKHNILKTIILFFLTTTTFATDKPYFSVVDTNGNTHTAQSTNSKFLVINFWATWCPPCVEEIPEFVDFYDKNKDRVEILGFEHEDVSREKSISFTDGFMIEYPIIMRKNQEAEFEKFPIQYLPTTFIYDKNGKLIKAHAGVLTGEQLQELTKE